MRVIDILLSEASIFTSSDYSVGHKVRPSSAGLKPGKLADQLAQFFPDYDKAEDLTWVNPPKKKPKAIITLGRDTSNARYFQRPPKANGTQGETFAVLGPDKTIQQQLTHAKGQKNSKAENKGDASEPVLSAAVVAKLIKRGTNNIEPVTEDDVKNVLNAVLKNPKLEYRVDDKNSVVADLITFTLRVKGPTEEFIRSPDFWEKYQPYMASVVHYANSGQLDHYANHFYKNGKADEINVKSDGISENKDRKTDVEAKVNGRALRNLNISLKAGSANIGQEGGGDINNPFKEQTWNEKKQKMTGNKGIWVCANDLFGPFGVQIPKPTAPITSRVEFWKDAYQTAVEQIQQQLAGADAKKEAGVVTRIANYVTKHGTNSDPNVKLIALGVKGISTIHSFKNLETKLVNQHINLECTYREGRSKDGTEPRPELRIIDKNSGQPALYIRYSSTQAKPPKVWNTVQMMDLLQELTTLNYQKQIPKNTDDVAEPTPTEVEPPATTSAGANIATPATLPGPKSNFIAPDTDAKNLEIPPVTYDKIPKKQFGWTGRQKLAPVGAADTTTFNNNEFKSKTSKRTSFADQDAEFAESKKKPPNRL